MGTLYSHQTPFRNEAIYNFITAYIDMNRGLQSYLLDYPNFGEKTHTGLETPANMRIFGVLEVGVVRNILIPV